MPTLHRSPDLQKLLLQDRNTLSSLVLFPLKKIKKFIVLTLTRRDVAQLVSYIDVQIRNLNTVITDGASLMNFLDDFYGEDSLHVLQDLAEKANCYSTLAAIQQWRAKSTHSSDKTLRGKTFKWLNRPNNWMFTLSSIPS